MQIIAYEVVEKTKAEVINLLAELRITRQIAVIFITHDLGVIAELADKLSEIGIKYQDTLVVVYDDSRLAFAARLWWAPPTLLR